MQPEKLERIKKLLELVKANTPEGKINAIKELLALVNEGISKKDFVSSFQKVIDHVLATEIKLIKKIDAKTEEEKQKLADLTSEFNKIVSEAKQVSEKTFGGIRTRTLEMIDSLFARNDVNKKLKEILNEATDKIAEVDEKLATVKSGRDGVDGSDGLPGEKGVDGKDADEEKIVAEVLSKVEKPEVDKEDLEELEKRLMEEIRLNKRLGGGGFSKIAMESKFIDDEVPSGTVNGVNTTFTLANTPNPPASVKVFVNGQRLKAGGEDYTLSGRTITFVSAPPTTSILLIDYRT